MEGICNTLIASSRIGKNHSISDSTTVILSKIWLNAVNARFFGVIFLSKFFSFSNLILVKIAHLATLKQWRRENKKAKTRSYLQKRPCRNNALKIYSEFMGEHQCQSLISKNLQSNFIEITLRHRCSPVNLLYIFRTLFFKNISGGVLLYLSTLFNMRTILWEQKPWFWQENLRIS